MTAPEQLTDELAGCAPEIVYLPLERVRDFPLERYKDKIEFCAQLPRICTDHETEALLALLEAAKEAGCTSICVQNLGQLALGAQIGLPMRGALA